MGYIQIETLDDGSQIIDGSRVLNVQLASSGNYIDFVLDFFTSAPNEPAQIRFNANVAGALNNKTLTQFNEAVIAAQNTAVVVIKSLPSQEIKDIKRNPAP